jgi:hypothetical protein
MKGKLTYQSDSRQAEIENPLANLGVALALLEHDRLRIRQAVGRYAGLLDLLGPVISDLDCVSRAITKAQANLRGEWERGQEERWQP